MQRRLRPVTVPSPVPPPPGVADRRRSRRLWGLGVEAQVQLSTAMRQLLVALDLPPAPVALAALALDAVLGGLLTLVVLRMRS